MEEFFQENHIYVLNEPFRAPELLTIFWCCAIATHPKDGTTRAFGFESVLADPTFRHSRSVANRQGHFANGAAPWDSERAWGGSTTWIDFNEQGWQQRLAAREEVDEYEEPKAKPVVYPADLIHKREPYSWGP